MYTPKQYSTTTMVMCCVYENMLKRKLTFHAHLSIRLLTGLAGHIPWIRHLLPANSVISHLSLRLDLPLGNLETNKKQLMFGRINGLKCWSSRPRRTFSLLGAKKASMNRSWKPPNPLRHHNFVWYITGHLDTMVAGW